VEAAAAAVRVSVEPFVADERAAREIAATVERQDKGKEDTSEPSDEPEPEAADEPAREQSGAPDEAAGLARRFVEAVSSRRPAGARTAAEAALVEATLTLDIPEGEVSAPKVSWARAFAASHCPQPVAKRRCRLTGRGGVALPALWPADAVGAQPNRAKVADGRLPWGGRPRRGLHAGVARRGGDQGGAAAGGGGQAPGARDGGSPVGV
jgi:hypothetical protein